MPLICETDGGEMISVALTTYNGEKYILEQLESIKKQTRSVDEVIVCDDGSTDTTIQLISEFIKINQLDTWKVFQNDENLGYSRNFFKAVRLCKGQYIFLCDQDDVWDKDKVKSFLSVMEGDEEIHAVSSNFTIINNIGEKTKKVSVTKKNREIQIQEVVGSTNVKGCTMCIKKELDDFIAHDDLQVGLQLGHDWYYNFLACLIGKNVAITNFLLLYRVHGENISLQRNQRKKILSTNKKKRVEIFEEMEVACKTVLEKCEKKISVDTRKMEQINRMLQFCVVRKNYVAEKNISLISLLKYMQEYKIIGQGWKGAFHALLSDFLYANEINGLLRWR